MQKVIVVFIILSSIFTSCKKDCVIVNPNNISYKGCSNFMVYGSIQISGLENSYVTVNVERDELNLNSRFKSFDIASNPHINSAIEMFNMPSGDCYCTDAIIADLEIINTWEIQSGIVEIRIVREKSECDQTYVVDVILANANNKDAEGHEVFVERKEFFNVLVNYLIG